jgi:hypothetical protein
VTQDLTTIRNEAYINTLCMLELMCKLMEKYGQVPMTLVLDNARYQRCQAVMEFAREKRIELLFLPPYSPNLNLIERLWKLVKKKCLYCEYYATFKQFKEAIDDVLDNTDKNYAAEVKSLMTLNFQVLDNATLSTQ